MKDKTTEELLRIAANMLQHAAMCYGEDADEDLYIEEGELTYMADMLNERAALIAKAPRVTKEASYGLTWFSKIDGKWIESEEES